MTKRKDIKEITTAQDINTLSHVVLYANNIERLLKNSQMVHDAPNVKYSTEGKKHILTFYSGSTRIKFRIPFDMEGASGDRSLADDILTFILCKLTENAKDPASNKDLRTIRFHLSELVGKNNLFSDIANARRGFKNAYYAIHDVDIEIKNEGEHFTNIVSDMEIKNGVVTLTLGKYLEWSKFENPYVEIPLKNLFALSKRARRTCKGLYRYIRTKAVSDSAILPITFIALEAGISVDYKNPKRVKETIKATINEINKAKGLRLHIVPQYSDEKDLELWLKKSFFIVYVKGYLSADMRKIQKSREENKKSQAK